MDTPTLDVLTEEANRCCQRAFEALAAREMPEWTCPKCGSAYRPVVTGKLRQWVFVAWMARL